MNKKWILPIVVLSLLVVGVSAKLVNDWGKAQVNVEFTEAITTVSEKCTFTAVAGGDYKLCMLDVTNNLDKTIDVDITLRVQKWDGTEYVNLADDDGLLVGLTEDVSYCFKGQGEMTTPVVITDCATQYEDWMLQNANWLDWEVLTQPYPGEYDISIVEGTGKTQVVNLTTGELIITGEEISANLNFQPVIYVDSASGLIPGNYRVELEISPATA